MPDYTKTIIYKLINYDCPDLVYVGSTTNFTNRKAKHKNDSKVKTIKLYETINNNGGWESWTMIKICDYPCLSSIEARQEEDRHMIELKANLNINRAERNQKQYNIDNKEKKELYEKQYRPQYVLDNKEKIAERQKQYRIDNKEKIAEQRKQYRPQYVVDNKEKIAERLKQYRIDNKEKIAEQRKQYYNKRKLLNAVRIDKTS